MRVRDFCVCVCVCVFNIICWNRLLDLKMISYIHDVIKINVVENLEPEPKYFNSEREREREREKERERWLMVMILLPQKEG